MITLYTLDDQRKVQDILKGNWSTAAPFFKLLIGNEDYSDRLITAKWGSAKDTPALTLQATLAGTLPARLENASVELVTEVDEVSIPQFYGKASRPRATTGDVFTTGLIAATPGALLDKITLDAYTTYPGYTPNRIILDALLRVPTYESGQISVEVTSTPVLTFTGDKGFSDDQTPANILAEVKKQADYVLYDTPFLGCVAEKVPQIGDLSRVIRTYNAGDLINYSPPTLADQQYTAVVARRVDPANRANYLVYAKAPIDTSYLPNPPVGPRTLFINFDDETASGPSAAQQTAYDRAERLKFGVFSASQQFPYDPLLTKYDAYLVNDSYEDDEQIWKISWLYFVDGFWHELLSTGEVRTTVEATVTRVSSEPQPAPLPAMAAAVLGQVSPMWGYNALGEIMVDDQLPWVSVNANGEIIVDDAYGTAVTNANGEIILRNAPPLLGITIGSNFRIMDLDTYKIGDFA